MSTGQYSRLFLLTDPSIVSQRHLLGMALLAVTLVRALAGEVNTRGRSCGLGAGGVRDELGGTLRLLREALETLSTIIGALC